MKKWTLKEFAILDDIGYIGIPGHKPSKEDRTFYAQKAEEARNKVGQHYRYTTKLGVKR